MLTFTPWPNKILEHPAIQQTQRQMRLKTSLELVINTPNLCTRIE